MSHTIPIDECPYEIRYEYETGKRYIILPSTSCINDCRSPIEVAYLLECHENNLDPVCQFSVGRFFLDFAFPGDRVAVELDGHNYHKTKEQRTADAQRHRWLELNDWRVIRFTGTEIHHNVASCVQQTIQFLEKVKEQRSHGSPAGSGA